MTESKTLKIRKQRIINVFEEIDTLQSSYTAEPKEELWLSQNKMDKMEKGKSFY